MWVMHVVKWDSNSCTGSSRFTHLPKRSHTVDSHTEEGESAGFEHKLPRLVWFVWEFERRFAWLLKPDSREEEGW